MTQDEYEVGSLENAEKFAIIRMAREAGFYGLPVDERLEHFAALVATYTSKLEVTNVFLDGLPPEPFETWLDYFKEVSAQRNIFDVRISAIRARRE